MADRVPLVYILSSGRSGTTLLDLLIGSAERAWTVGEAQLLPWELREDRAPCGCGEGVPECRFWRELLPELPLEDEMCPVDYFRESYGAGRVLRWRHIGDLVRGGAGDSRRKAAEAYAGTNARYLAKVREAASAHAGVKIRWLVDASMDPYRLLWLRSAECFQLRVIHLTKSPPGFVYSMVKDELPAGRRKAVRMAGRWLVENALMVRLCNTAFEPSQVRHLRYEDLAGRPEVVRCALGDWLALEFPEWSGRTFRAYENHAISGNRMRWEDTEIRLDQRWRDRLPAFHRGAAQLIAAPLAGRLGH